MVIACCKSEVIRNERQQVFIEGPVSALKLSGLYMNKNMSNFRTPAQQKEALVSIANLPEGMIYIARQGREIIGYVTFHYPEKFSRWGKHPLILELGGIEISPDCRKSGIGALLLKYAFANPVMEDYIVVTIEFCWHWDLEESGLELFEYQKVLEKLFGVVGLERRATDDPDIIEHPANVLMVRVGKNIHKADVESFETMLFEGLN